jgi:ABC-type transporter Mla subunit MlaD
MTWQSEVRAWAVASAAVFCLGAIGYKAITFPKLDGIVGNINTVTKTMADASKAQASSFAAIERDFRVEMWHLDTSLTTVDATLKTAQGTLQTASGTIGAVQGTLTATNEQLAHVGPLLDSARLATDHIPPVLDGLQPVEANVNGAVSDVRTFINQPSLTQAIANFDNMTNSGAGILWDARQVADKETKDFLKPVKWYMVPVKYTGEFIDIGAAIARHAP